MQMSVLYQRQIMIEIKPLYDVYQFRLRRSTGLKRIVLAEKNLDDMI